MVHLKEGKVGECNIATHVKSQKVKSQKFFEFIYLSLFKVSTTDIVKNYVELEILTGNDLIFFLTAIWLPHGQLWTIIEEAASLTRC